MTGSHCASLGFRTLSWFWLATVFACSDDIGVRGTDGAARDGGTPDTAAVTPETGAVQGGGEVDNPEGAGLDAGGPDGADLDTGGPDDTGLEVGNPDGAGLDAGNPRPVESFACRSLLSDVLMFHPVCLDDEGKLVPWTQAAAPYADVAARAWTALKSATDLPNGKPAYYSSPMFVGTGPDVWAAGNASPHHPAGVLAMFVDSALRYYAYSGDAEVLTTVVLPFADHLLSSGMTEPTDAWASVPYSCSDYLSLTYHGANLTTGSGDGYGYLEPDKVGEVGFAFLLLYEQTGTQRYLDTALACADALVSHQQPGDDVASPWPFRVDAATGQDVRDPYCAQVVGALRLLRELARLGVGDPSAYRKAHDAALDWAMAVPFVNHEWSNYFEDAVEVPLHTNRNQYAPMELARYLLQYPDVTSDAAGKAKALIDWVTSVFTQDFTNYDGAGGFLFEPGIQFGAEAVSEQELDADKMGSHTARFASVLARYYEATGDASARARAFRSFNWASYCASDDGLVTVGPNPREGFWFSDGYGDYIRHFMAGLGSIPEWAPPAENHLVRTSSVVQAITLGAPNLSYTTFDATAEEVLRLAARPASVAVGGRALAPGEGNDTYSVVDVANGGVVVLLRRTGGRVVDITF